MREGRCSIGSRMIDTLYILLIQKTGREGRMGTGHKEGYAAWDWQDGDWNEWTKQ